MSLTFEASQDSTQSIKDDIGTLLNLIKTTENDKQRELLIKISIIILVTKFQVFVENILDEFLDWLNRNQFRFVDLPSFIKLNSIKVKIENYKLHQKLKNSQKYKNKNFMKEVKEILNSLNIHFSNEVNDGHLQLKCKFPLGKTGANELSALFSQINGENIYKICDIDDNKLNSLLNIRHNVIHKDATPGLTEGTIISYRDYLIDFIAKIDKYLYDYIRLLKTNTYKAPDVKRKKHTWGNID